MDKNTSTETAAPEQDEKDASQAGQVVVRLGRLLAVVPSLRPTRRAWLKLGFLVSPPFGFLGCLAFDVILAGGSLRFLAPAGDTPDTPLGSVVTDRLTGGAGLLGWSWACRNVDRSRTMIEQRSAHLFPENHEGRKTVIVPPMLSPAVTTLLEPAGNEPSAAHPNGVTHLDHVVLAVTNTASVAEVYEKHFGLKATSVSMNDRRYAFLKVGESLIEIVGPVSPDSGPVSGHAWGVAFRSMDLDGTVATMRRAGVEIPDPHRAIQSGRITGLPMSLGGIQIAFLGP